MSVRIIESAGRYPILTGASMIARIVGWAGIAIAAIGFIWGAADVFNAVDVNGNYQHINPFVAIQGLLKIGGAISLAFLALLVILVSEAVSVFIDIEANTRRTAEATTRQRIPENIVEGAPPKIRGFGVGADVRHQVFGIGTITETLGNDLVRVVFKNDGHLAVCPLQDLRQI